ncbi:MAG: type III secretion system chaperone, partial [Comamonas sp.]
MESDSATSLELWATSIEAAWGITLGHTDGGAFVLDTAGGTHVGIEPLPERRALVLTAELGEVDAHTSLRLYQALLALNLSPVLTGAGCIGIEPQTQKILLRLTWSPDAAQWTEES